MDFSYTETSVTTPKSECTELEDKSFVNQFIDAKGKIWERNNFIESYEENSEEQTNNSYKFVMPKVESGQTEESLLVKTETGLKDFFDGERKISDQEFHIKSEPCEDEEIDYDENGAVIPNIKSELSEEDSETLLHKLLDKKNWPMSKDSLKVKAVKKNKAEVDNHEAVSRKYKCTECDYEALRKSHLKDHVNSVHLGIKNYKCNQCDYQASRKSHLKVHVNNIHLGIRSHKCSQCDYRTTQKVILKRHVDYVHLGIKNFKCSECEYRATHKSHLKDHMNSKHPETQIHNCSHCDYEASRRGNLVRHVNSVHFGIKSHECGLCDYKATDKSRLKDHIDRVHFKNKKTPTWSTWELNFCTK
ncbi:hypothetical protein HHI36_021677 [Cryptolaemus montrouzieri]|uniref:C2H2-type domain-containing protein n=1 Tax=Cryptolaemus montrouzieri TaxID=559131 RepID=A0ABD2MXV5_9CUCU